MAMAANCNAGLMVATIGRMIIGRITAAMSIVQFATAIFRADGQGQQAHGPQHSNGAGHFPKPSPAPRSREGEVRKAEATVQDIRKILETAWEHDDSEGQTLVEIETRLEEHFGKRLRPLPDFDY
jgi:hypothetical protein